MRFVKAQLFLIVCGLVVLLALASLYWPISTSRAALEDQMNSRLTFGRQAVELDAIPYQIPGSSDVNQKGPVTDKLISVKNLIINKVAQQAEEINQLVSRDNELHRVVNGVPLLGNVPQNNYLPKLARDSMDFKVEYGAIYKRWLGLLLKGAEDPGSNFNVYTEGAPPSMAEIDKLIKDEEAQKVAAAPRLSTGQVIQPVAAQMNAREKAMFIRSTVSDRAKRVAMYVTPDAFQIRPCASEDKAPDERQIFEALVDSWVQQDIVDAILSINKNSRSVENSAIKRLELIAIGADSAKAEPSGSVSSVGALPGTLANSGPWYVLQGATGAAPTGMAAAPGAGASGAQIDFSKSMTGRVSVARADGRYDVAHVKVILDLNPSSLNRFIAALYQQNNGYTVLSIPRVDAVDPFDAASKGYLYGQEPVVRVEMVVESLFFRRWTEPLMPDSIKNELGIPLAKPGGFGIAR